MHEKGEKQEALADAQQAVDIAPDSKDARFNLGFMLYSVGQFEQAIVEYNEALQLAGSPEEIDKYDQAKMLDFLARAYAAAGRFPEAITTAEKALELALSSGRKDLMENISRQLKSFKQAQNAQQQP